jgi:hypothetical protein
VGDHDYRARLPRPRFGEAVPLLVRDPPPEAALITRRVTRPRSVGGGLLPTPPPLAPLVDEVMMYKGHQIEAASYCVGNVAWSPRAVVSVRTEGGAWERTPLYATSTARFPTRHEADHKAVDVAKAWVDAALAERQPPDM